MKRLTPVALVLWTLAVPAADAQVRDPAALTGLRSVVLETATFLAVEPALVRARAAARAALAAEGVTVLDQDGVDHEAPTLRMDAVLACRGANCALRTSLTLFDRVTVRRNPGSVLRAPVWQDGYTNGATEGEAPAQASEQLGDLLREFLEDLKAARR